MRQIHVDVGSGGREREREREGRENERKRERDRGSERIEGEKLALGGVGGERDEEKTGARGGEEGRLMYGVYLFADTDKHEQNQHPDTEPGQSESVLIVELIDPTKLISRYSAKSPRYCSPTSAPSLPPLALFLLRPATRRPTPSSSAVRRPLATARVSYPSNALRTRARGGGGGGGRRIGGPINTRASTRENINETAARRSLVDSLPIESIPRPLPFKFDRSISRRESFEGI